MGARHGPRPASRRGRSRGRGARGAGAAGTACGGARRGGSGRRRRPAMGDPARLSGARARKARAETRAQPAGPGEELELRGPVFADLRVNVVPSTYPGGGGVGGWRWARPGLRHCLHVPVCGSQQPRPPSEGNGAKASIQLGDSGGARAWSAWMHASALSLGHITPSSRVCLSISDLRD